VKALFVVAFIANLVLTVAAMMLCPGTVASHFGAGGEPDGWMPSQVDALVMAGACVLLFVSFHFTPFLMRITPARWVNLPNTVVEVPD
jgi:uncharacterized membrane protein